MAPTILAAMGARTGDILISTSSGAVRVPHKRLAALVRFVARRQGVRLGQVDLAIVGRRRMATLHRRYLRRRGATDVLSFKLTAPGERRITAQVVVCADVAVAEARRRGLAPQRELMLYVVHGLLHVMGYDDRTPARAAKMRRRQEELLEEFLGH